MSATTTEAVQAHEHEGHEPPYAEQTKRNRMGLWLFFFSEIFLFGAIFSKVYAGYFGSKKSPAEKTNL